MIREFFSGDEQWAQQILDRGFDPEVASFASMGELEENLLSMGVPLYFGPTHLHDLDRYGTLVINPNRMTTCFGYQIPLMILDQILAETKCGGVKHGPV